MRNVLFYTPTVVRFPYNLWHAIFLSYGKIGKYTLNARTTVLNYNLKYITQGVRNVISIYSIFPNLTRQKHILKVFRLN